MIILIALILLTNAKERLKVKEQVDLAYDYDYEEDVL